MLDLIRARITFSSGRLLPVAFALWFLVCSLGFGFPVTPEGVQCPTASVQHVSVGTYCCGKLVGTHGRAPRPGDKGFVQCRCAEKKASQTKSSGSTRLQWVITHPEEMVIVPDPLFRQVRFLYDPRFESVDQVPSIRPPDRCAA